MGALFSVSLSLSLSFLSFLSHSHTHSGIYTLSHSYTDTNTHKYTEKKKAVASILTVSATGITPEPAELAMQLINLLDEHKRRGNRRKHTCPRALALDVDRVARLAQRQG